MLSLIYNNINRNIQKQFLFHLIKGIATCFVLKHSLISALKINSKKNQMHTKFLKLNEHLFYKVNKKKCISRIDRFLKTFVPPSLTQHHWLLLIILQKIWQSSVNLGVIPKQISNSNNRPLSPITMFIWKYFMLRTLIYSSSE